MKLKIASFLLATTLVSTPAFAWEQIISCDSGLTVIDRADNGFEIAGFQLVIRHAAAISELGGDGAFLSHRINARGEAIIPLKVNRRNSKEFIGEDDAYRINGRVYYVKPMGERLIVETFRTSQPTGGIYSVGEQILVSTFEGCTTTLRMN